MPQRLLLVPRRPPVAPEPAVLRPGAGGAQQLRPAAQGRQRDDRTVLQGDAAATPTGILGGHPAELRFLTSLLAGVGRRLPRRQRRGGRDHGAGGRHHGYQGEREGGGRKVSKALRQMALSASWRNFSSRMGPGN